MYKLFFKYLLILLLSTLTEKWIKSSPPRSSPSTYSICKELNNNLIKFGFEYSDIMTDILLSKVTNEELMKEKLPRKCTIQLLLAIERYSKKEYFIPWLSSQTVSRDYYISSYSLKLIEEILRMDNNILLLEVEEKNSNIAKIVEFLKEILLNNKFSINLRIMAIRALTHIRELNYKINLNPSLIETKDKTLRTALVGFFISEMSDGARKVLEERLKKEEDPFIKFLILSGLCEYYLRKEPSKINLIKQTLFNLVNKEGQDKTSLELVKDCLCFINRERCYQEVSK